VSVVSTSGSSIAAKWPPWLKSVQRVQVFCSSAVATNADVWCEDDCGGGYSGVGVRRRAKKSKKYSSQQQAAWFAPWTKSIGVGWDSLEGRLSITSSAFAAKREPRLTNS
jgi:hypothetical protein